MTFATAGILLGMASCNEIAPVQKAESSRLVSLKDAATNGRMEDNLKITIGPKTFKATFEGNDTVAKLKELMPLTLEMSELNGNEKYYHLSSRLPTDEISPGTIQNGDIMLYGDNSLVLFYKTFKTSYSYTGLGRVDDPSGLADAVGTGDISVAFELEN